MSYNWVWQKLQNVTVPGVFRLWTLLQMQDGCSSLKTTHIVLLVHVYGYTYPDIVMKLLVLYNYFLKNVFDLTDRCQLDVDTFQKPWS